MMALILRPTGLGAGIDKDRPDYTVYSGDWAMGVSTSSVAVQHHHVIGRASVTCGLWHQKSMRPWHVAARAPLHQ
jgi:hypothetical protein